jgi:acyl-CoA synthetase (AMP-forming)/AMP-acid ligase II
MMSKTPMDGASDGLPLDGREKDVIIRGGSIIFPEEIENVLLSHPLVRDAAVFGAPDPELGSAWRLSCNWRTMATTRQSIKFWAPSVSSWRMTKCRSCWWPSTLCRATRSAKLIAGLWQKLFSAYPLTGIWSETWRQATG